jgi:UDPglucose 6-dehydrogenase
MSFAIIGNGFVGQATKILKTNDTKMLVYDIDPSKCEPAGLQLKDLADCDIIFISVPTPMNKDGRNYLGIVESVVDNLKKVVDLRRTHLVIRSTVLAGTSDRLGCYFMPEFLTEKNWDYDFRNCEKWIFGLLGKETDEDFQNKINKIFQNAYLQGNIKYNDVSFVRNAEAEMIKYFRNTFLSLKVSFCNEIYDLCQKKGINYENVRELATLDKRICASHSSVPGHDGKRGFGGTCFPKDTTALLKDFEDSGVDSYLLKAAIERNNKVDRPKEDWKDNKGRAVVE